MVSSTETSVGAVVNVSCPAGQKLQTGHQTMTELCLRSGVWSPQVPDCIGKITKMHETTDTCYSLEVKHHVSK